MNTLTIQSFVEQDTNYKRILVVEKIDRIKNYIRSIKTDAGERFDKVVKNVDYKTIIQLATDVYFYQCAMEDKNERIVISDMEATIILKNILLANIEECVYFTDKNLITLSMTKELHSVITYIRRNSWKAVEDEDANRIKDLKFILDKYETYLTDNNLIDNTLLLKEALEWVKNNAASDKQILEEICGGVVSALFDDSEENSTLEDDFTLALMNGTEGDVVILSKENTIDAVRIPREKVQFFKSYGSMNEANYVVNDILKNEYSFGDVKVVYTAPAQQPLIEAALKGNGIPANFVSSVSLANNAVVDLFRKILAWAKDDYSERTLEQVMSNTSLFVEGYYQKNVDELSTDEVDMGNDALDSEEEQEDVSTDNTEKTEREELAKLGLVPYNYIGGGRYFDHILHPKKRKNDGYHLGWGYDRNRQFIEREVKLLAEERAEFIEASQDKVQSGELTETDVRKYQKRFDSREEVLKLHSALLDIFENTDNKEINPGEIYENLIHFMDIYVKKKSFDYRRAKSAIYEAKNYLSREDAMNNLEGVIDYLDNTLLSLTTNDSGTDHAVLVDRMNSWIELDRPYVYIVGLSLQDLQGSSTESAILRDLEYEIYTEAPYKQTTKAVISKKVTNFYRSLLTFYGQKICFGFSYFDVAGFCETNPSAIYRELLGKYGRTLDDLPEFIYGKASGTHKEDGEQNVKQATIFVDTATSNSSLEKFINCPKAYAYEKRLHLYEDAIMDRNNKRFKWLNYAQRGTFFHNVAEKYVTEKMIMKSDSLMSEHVDEDYIYVLVEQEKQYTLEKIPYNNLGDVDDDVEEIKQALIDYFEKLHNNRCASGKECGWKILAAEREFNNVSYSVISYNKQQHNFVFNGYIDRIDYKVDDNKKEIWIRVIDYKTGEKQKKKAANDLGKLSQHIIYKQAILNKSISSKLIEDISQLEDRKELKNYKIQFEQFIYDFPMDDCNCLEIPSDMIESVNLVRWKVALTAMEDLNLYPDKVDIYTKTKEYCDNSKITDANLNLFKSNIEKDEKMSPKYADGCKYCAYEHLCLKRREGEI